MEVLSADAAADTGHLRPPGIDTDLRAYLSRLYGMRYFASATARYGVNAKNSHTVLGRLWLLLEPALLIAIYWLMFGLILGRAEQGVNFVAYLTVGTVIFDHSRSGVISGSSALVANIAILRSFSFPRAVLPLIQIIRSALNAVFATVVMFIVLPIMGTYPSLGWLAIAPLLGVQMALNFGLALLIARPITRFPDLRQSLPYVFRLLFYSSGVIFPVESVLEDRTWGPMALDLLTLNPFYSVVSLARWATIGIRPVNVELVLTSVSCWTLLSLSIGMLVFVRGEREFSGVRTVVLDQ